MQITERDKKLLAFLGVVLVVFLYYRFVYTTQSAKLQELFIQKEEKELQLTQAEAKVSRLVRLENELKTEKEAIMPLAKKYLSNINQEDLILLINDYESKSAIKIDEVSFSEADQEQISSVVQNTKSQDDNATTPANTNPTNNTSNNNQTIQQPATENAKTDENAKPQFMASDNIKMTNADIKFSGTYSDLAALINILDTSGKNIVSNKLDIKKKDNSDAENISQVSDENIEGTLNLQFFKVASLEKYESVKESPLVKEPIKRGIKKAPVMGYDWAKVSVIQYDKSTGKIINKMSKQEYDNKNKVSGTPSIPTQTPAPDVITSGNGVQDGDTKSQSLIEYKKPVELARFDSMNDLLIYSEDKNIVGNIAMETVPDIGYKIIREDIEFSKESPIDSKMIMSIAKKKIVIKEKPASIVINTYLSKSYGYEIGLLFENRKEVKYIPFTEKLSFIGWKELELKLDGLDLPANLTGIYVKRNNESDPINGNFYIDSLYANYIQSK